MTTYTTQNTPFVYFLQFSSGKKYIGSRTKQGCHPSQLGKTYFTSSEYVKRHLKEGNTITKKVIIKEFESGQNKEALELEALCQKKVDAASNGSYLNEHNGDGKFSAAGKVIARNKNTGENLFVSCEEFENNPNLEHVSKGKVSARNKITGKKLHVTKEELKNNPDLEHVHKGKATVRNKITGEKLHVTKEELKSNPDLEHLNKGKVVARNKITGEKLHVTKDEFKNNPNLEHVHKGKATVYDLETQTRISISKDDYHRHKGTRYLNLNSKAFKELKAKNFNM